MTRVWVLLLSIVVGAGAYVLGNCGVSQGCSWHSSLAQYSFTIFEPLLIYSTCLVPVGVSLVFVSSRSFFLWASFARWWIPLSILLIVVTPTSSNTWMPLYSLEKEGVTWLMGGLFLLISFGILIRAHFKKN